MQRITSVTSFARAGLLVALLLCCLPAGGALGALRLEPVPGPDGPGAPFRSPHGAGPMFVASPPGDTHRVFVGTRDGVVYVIVDGELRSTPYADLHDLTTVDNANGLQSFTFDEDGRMYVMYSDTNETGLPDQYDTFRDLRIDVVSPSASDPDRADLSTRANVITIPSIWQDGCALETAHHGGQVHLGEDGNLWISVGDGGDGCGAHFGASSLTTLRGKILRIAPTPGGGYTIPASNPLAGQAGVRQEIWANGLRNPWRFTFDRAADEVVIADVGNDQFEEVNVVPSALPAGAPPPFFGWGCFEHTAVIYAPCPLTQARTDAVMAFAHAPEGGCVSLTGGVVVDDPSLGAEYQGRYLYGYFCAPTRGQDGGGSRLLSVDLHAATPTPRSEDLFVTVPGGGAGFGLSSFGEDGCGHPYAMNVLTGWLFRIEGDTPGPCGQHRPPQTTITEAPEGRVEDPDARVAFASTVRGSTFLCRLDGGPPEPCASPAVLADLADGRHALEVAARDEAGNVDPTPARASWRTDARPPETRIVTPPSGPNPSIAFEVDDGEARCALDDAPAVPCSSPWELRGVPPGRHTVTVGAVDEVGRVDPTPAAATWDVQPPQPQPTDPFVPAGDDPLVPAGDDPRAVAPFAAVRVDGARRARASRTRRVRLALIGFSRATTVTATVTRAGRRAGTARRITAHAGRRARVTIALSRATWSVLRRTGKVTLRVALRLSAPGAAAREVRVTLAVLRPR